MPGATLRPQLLVLRVNSGGLAPVTVMLVILKAELPVLVSVVVKDLVRPVFTVPNSKLAGAIFTVPLVKVIVAAADLVVSVTDVGVSVTVAGVGRVMGAVYVVGAPLNVLGKLIEPQPEQEVAFCEITQVAPAFAGSFAIVAVKS